MGEQQRVPLGSLRLDPITRGLPADLQGQGQEDLAVHLELGFDALTVAESIASHGFFGSEPLIVIADETGGDDGWSSREIGGSPRSSGSWTNAFAHSSPTLQPWEALAAHCARSRRTTSIPVVVLPDRAAATPIIGFRHISGILQWQPYAQARYVARLVDEEGMSFADVADMIGIDRTKVGNLYRDQAIAKQAREFGIETGPLEESFSLLTVAMSTPKLREHIGAPLGSKTEPGVPPVPADKAGALKELDDLGVRRRRHPAGDRRVPRDQQAGQRRGHAHRPAVAAPRPHARGVGAEGEGRGRQSRG